jgi:hypothetical protein
MPYFWSTAHWKMQYSLDVDCKTDMSIKSVKATVYKNKKYNTDLIGQEAISLVVPKRVTRC